MRDAMTPHGAETADDAFNTDSSPRAQQSAPASFSQRRLWFLNRLQQDQPCAYNTAVSFDVIGPIDKAALARAFSAIIERHEVLRTTFALQGEQPVQVVHGEFAFELELIDLHPRTAVRRSVELARLERAIAERAFD